MHLEAITDTCADQLLMMCQVRYNSPLKLNHALIGAVQYNGTKLSQVGQNLCGRLYKRIDATKQIKTTSANLSINQTRDGDICVAET